MADDTLKSRSEIKRMVAVDPWTVIHEVEKLKSQLASLFAIAKTANSVKAFYYSGLGDRAATMRGLEQAIISYEATYGPIEGGSK